MARKPRQLMTKARVFLLNTEVKTQNKYILLSLRAALAAHPQVEAVTLGSHGTAIHDFIDGKYEVFIGVGGAADNAPLLARLCGLARISVLWTTEDPYELEANVRLSDVFDIVFTNDLASVPAYNGRAQHLPLAASELFNDLDVIEDDAKYRYDVLFIGTAWPNRVVTINNIMRHFRSRIRMKVALPHNQFLEPPKLIDPGLVINWRCSNIDFARLANRSRVVLSLQRHFSAASDHHAAGSTPPPRLFEGALAGGFQVYISDNAEATRYFEAGREFVPCKDDNQAIAAIEEALAAPEQRIAIARAGRARAQAEHTYRHRIDHIMTRVVKRLAIASPVRPSGGERTLLVVTHNMQNAGHGGGIEIYQENLKKLPTKYRVLYLFPVRGSNKRTLRLLGLHNQAVDYPIDHPGTKFDLHDSAVENIFERILYEQNVGIVHFQHLLGFPLSLPLIARACGVPNVWTSHDHYLICNRYTLLDFEGRFCDTANKTSAHCDVCLAADDGQPNGSQIRRRNFVSTVLGAIDTVITNTLFTSNYMRAVYPQIAPEKIRVVEMLMPNAKQPEQRKNAPARTAEPLPLEVAIPGNFTDVKGAHYLIRLFNLTRDEDIRYTILGRVDPEFTGLFQSLSLNKVTMRGSYHQNEVLELLQGFHVSLHVSTWPETYMIALSEAWSAGLIPIVTDLGAQTERVTDGMDGFKVPPHDPAAIAICLRRIQSGDVNLDDMRAAIAAKRMVTPEAHLDQLRSIYDELVHRYPASAVHNVLRYQRYYSMTAFNAGVRTNAPAWNRKDVVWDQRLDDQSHTAPVALPTVLLDDVPGHYAHLPRTTMTIRDPKVRWALDDISVDGELLKGTVSRFTAGHSIRLRGWINVDNSLTLVETFIGLKSPSVSVLALAPRDWRQDVGDSVCDGRASASGFDVVIPLSSLPEDLYEISAVHVYDGSIATLGGLGELKIRRRDITTRNGDWVIGVKSFIERRPTIRVESAGVAIEISGAEAIAEDVVGLPAGSWLNLSGWTEIVDGYELASRVAVVLENINNGEAMWVQAKRRRRPPGSGKRDPMLSYSGFVIDIDLPPRVLGTYRLKVLQDFGDAVGVTDDLGMVHLRDPKWPAEVIAESADFLLTRPIRSVVLNTAGFWCTVDRVSEDTLWDGKNESTEEIGPVYVEGWMFHKGLGALKHLLVSWQEDSLKLFRKISLLPRPDVVEVIREPDAARCGFFFELPSDADDLQMISCLQVYSEGTVAFPGFGALVAEARAELRNGLSGGPLS